mgnify:CR=1 FL=1
MCERGGGERERAQMGVILLIRLPNGGQEVMGSTPTFHNGISSELRDICEVIER